MAFCTYVTETGRRSLRVQIQLAVTPGSTSHSIPHLQTPSPTHCPPQPNPTPPTPHRGIVDCAIWRNISLLWLQWQRNAHYIYQTAGRWSKRNKNRNHFRTNQSEEFSLTSGVLDPPARPHHHHSCGEKQTHPEFCLHFGAQCCRLDSVFFLLGGRKLDNDKITTSTEEIQLQRQR